MRSELAPWGSVLDKGRKQKAYLDYIGGWEKKIGSFLQIDAERFRPLADSGELAGIPFAVKDNISVEGFQASCGSKLLEKYIAPYNATCVERIAKQGARVIGKTNLDEFGMGSSTDNSALQVTNNPYGKGLVPGGSSGGSAAAVAAGLVPFALGTDTGGSVRQPASFCGVYGLKPTYGAVSRFGLVAYASSLECAGVLARSIGLTEDVFAAMKGEDERDHTSLTEPEEAAKARAAGEKVVSVATLKGLDGLEPGVEAAYRETIEALKAQGIKVVEMAMPSLEYVVPAYYTIATAEASANLARYTGIGYGRRTDFAENYDELIRKSRSEGFGDEVKLRILLGTYVLRSGFQARYYVRAQKIRTEIRNEFAGIFKECQLVLMPTFPVLPFAHGDSGMDQFQQKVADKFTCTGNLSGLPGLNVPTGLSGGKPVGMQFMAPAFREDRLFAAARLLESAFPLPRPEGFSEEFLK